MSKDVGVLIVHGMGTQQPNFADEMIGELSDLIDDPQRVAWQPVFWADVLQPRQEDFLRRANSRNQLDFLGLRRFVVGALGDAAAYRRIDDSPETTYRHVHTAVRDAVRALYRDPDKLARRAKPLIILAHSLGGHIMSNYIWDLQRDRPIVAPGDNPFERLETLGGIVTFGCNIPIFTFALDEVVPIDLPSGARWLNFFDRDDVLGYPLKPINRAYRRTVSRDIAIDVGGPLSSWTPLSHTEYWTDNDLTEPVASLISKLLRAR